MSPLRAMTEVYHDRYHGTYVHARKLFLFDIFLFLGTLVLIASTLFWYTYDPSVVQYVNVTVSVTDQSDNPLTRIASGEVVRYTIFYENTSQSLLTRPEIHVRLPQYFHIEDIIAPTIPYNESTRTFHLPDILPGDGGTIQIDGVYFGTPDADEDVTFSLSYTQDGRTATEVRHARIISTLRDAVLAGTLEAPTMIRGTGTYPLTMTLSNTGERPLPAVSLPTDISFGTIAWDYPDHTEQIALDPGETHIINGTFHAAVPTHLSDITLSITPSILLDGAPLPQETETAQIAVVHPRMELSPIVFDAAEAAPDSAISASITIANTGNTPISDIRLTIPLNTNIIDSTRSAHAAGATLSGGALVLRTIPTLAPGQTETVVVPIVIRAVPQGGTDTQLTLSPSVSGAAAGGDAQITAAGSSDPIRIGTTLLLTAHSRYYTTEGDQLGRGPLPPQVGTETKYWVLVTLQNTSSHVNNPVFTATLGPNVSWTGRTSVTLGSDLTYDATTRSIRWNWGSIPPAHTVGIYMELAVVPTEQMLGTVPVLLTNLSAQGTDSYITHSLKQSIDILRADLTEDDRGRGMGILVSN